MAQGIRLSWWAGFLQDRTLPPSLLATGGASESTRFADRRLKADPDRGAHGLATRAAGLFAEHCTRVLPDPAHGDVDQVAHRNQLDSGVPEPRPPHYPGQAIAD